MKMPCTECGGSGQIEHIDMILGHDGYTYYMCTRCGTNSNFPFICRCDVSKYEHMTVRYYCYYCEKPLASGEFGGKTIIKDNEYWVCKRKSCLHKLREDFSKK